MHLVIIFIYHFLGLHGLQYLVHYITHHKKSPLMFSKNHKLHHGNPVKITWHGTSTFSYEQTNSLTDLYYITATIYALHMYYFFYDNIMIHSIAALSIVITFKVFHGMCHYLTLEQQKRIPIINVLFYHHYKHHLNTNINLGFGDIIYDYFLGTLDLSPIDRTDKEFMKNKERIDKKYFIK